MTLASGPGGSRAGGATTTTLVRPPPVRQPGRLRRGPPGAHARAGGRPGRRRRPRPRGRAAGLREARASLAEITEQLQEALGEAKEAAALQSQLDELDETLRSAHDDAARSDYAQVLAQLEPRPGRGGHAPGRHEGRRHRPPPVVPRRGRPRPSRRHGGRPPTPSPPSWPASAAPSGSTPPIWRRATSHRGDRAGRSTRWWTGWPMPWPTATRSTIASRPSRSPSCPRRPTWWSVSWGSWSSGPCGRRRTGCWPRPDEVQRVQMSMGGLGGDESRGDPTAITDMEVAHRDLEEAERAAEAVRVPGVAGTALGVTAIWRCALWCIG